MWRSGTDIRQSTLVQAVCPACRHTSPTHPHDHHAPAPLTAPGAVATAVRGTSTRRLDSTPDRSARRPSLACRAATAWLSLSRCSVPAEAQAGVRCHAAGKSCGTSGTMRAAAARRPRPCTAWGCEHAGGEAAREGGLSGRRASARPASRVSPGGRGPLGGHERLLVQAFLPL